MMTKSWKMVKRIAKQYRDIYPDTTIRRSVLHAVVSYELYTEASLEIYDEVMEKEYSDLY
jgi:hypothetical protein